MKAPRAGWIKSRLKKLAEETEGLDYEQKLDYVADYMKQFAAPKGAVTEDTPHIVKISEASGVSKEDVRLISNSIFSPISDYSLNEFVKQAMSETGDLRKHIDKITKSSYYSDKKEGLQARYIRRQGCFEFGGEIIDTSCNDICPECCNGYGIDLRY
jgi:hypothetical protein